MKWVFKHQDLQMLISNQANMCNFHTLHIVSRDSEAHLVSGIYFFIVALYGLSNAVS